jgi:hypothetical protein
MYSNTLARCVLLRYLAPLFATDTKWPTGVRYILDTLPHASTIRTGTRHAGTALQGYLLGYYCQGHEVTIACTMWPVVLC